MDILNATKDYADCISGGAITTPTGGTWVSAAALYLGATGPINGSWLQALCVAEGVTAPVNGSWVIALANHYGVTQPKNNSWWYAIADDACNGAPPLPPPFIWNLNTKNWEAEIREWAPAPTIDPDAQAFLTATGITDPTQESAVNQLVLDLKAAAIWTKMTAVYPIVGGTATTHKYNLVDPQDTDAAYRLDFNGTFTHSANGAAGGGAVGSDWADSHWIPASQSFTNGVHWSANVYSGQTTGAQYNMGIATASDWALINGFLNQTDYWQAGTGGYLTHTGDSPSDWLAGASNGTNFRALYDDGVQVASNATGGIDTTTGISAYLWAVNNSGTSANNSNDTMNFFTIGEYLDSTEMTALYNAVTAFNTTLGR